MSACFRLSAALSFLLVACDGSDDGDSIDRGQYLIGGVLCEDTLLTTVEGEDDGSGVADAGAPNAESHGGSLSCGTPSTDLPSSNLPSTGSGTLIFDGREFGLDNAIRVPAVDPRAGPDDDLLLHDGETRVLRRAEVQGDRTVRRIDYGVYDGTLALSFELFRAHSGDDPSGRVYGVLPPTEDFDEEGDVGEDVAIGTLLVVDIDGDGAITSAAEFFEPISGQIVWSGTELTPSLSFTFVLEDGRAVEGSYEGGYESLALDP